MLVEAVTAGVKEKQVQERQLDKGEDLTLDEAIENPQQFKHSQKQMIIREEACCLSSVSTRPKHAVHIKSQQSHAQQNPFQ